MWVTTQTWPLMHKAIDDLDIKSVIKYLAKGPTVKLTHGPIVYKFEKEWSRWLGVKYSIFVNSGASANDLTMKYMKHKYGPGEVIVPTLTWVSDISAVLNNGFDPVFVDIDPKTLGMATEEILKKITKYTRAVFLTHVLGFNALTDKLIYELKRKKIKLIEDVCESHGAKHKAKKLGTYGFISNFSFYYAHHMTTIEGGMICTNDFGAYDDFRSLRSHGLLREKVSARSRRAVQQKYTDLNPEFIFIYPSHNMRPTEIGGILGLSQLKKLDRNIRKRNNNFEYFVKGLNKERYRINFELSGMSSYALVLVLIKKDLKTRNRIEKVLKKHRIEFRRGLSGGGNQLRQPYLRNYLTDLNLKDFAEVEHVHHYAWYIGNYPELTLQQIDDLLNILNKI